MGYSNVWVIAVGNNDWTNGFWRNAGVAICESVLHNREELQGIKIRKPKRTKDGSWKEREMPQVRDLEL